MPSLFSVTMVADGNLEVGGIGRVAGANHVDLQCLSRSTECWPESRQDSERRCEESKQFQLSGPRRTGGNPIAKAGRLWRDLRSRSLLRRDGRR